MPKHLKNIIAVGAMSAGKSSVLNALIGQELLYSANEAATGVLTQLFGKRHPRYASICYDANQDTISAERAINKNVLKQWNSSEEVYRIDVFKTVKSKSLRKTANKLTFLDTPGANNSQNTRHYKLFHDALSNYNNGFILYILNCTQLGTTDDQQLLTELRTAVPPFAHKNILFVLNKVDALDEEEGEDLKKYVLQAKDYLESNGFQEPVIIPVMAYAALVAKKILRGEKITRKERSTLRIELERFRDNKHYLNDAALIQGNVKNIISKKLETRLPFFKDQSEDRWNSRELDQFFYYSGLATIEHTLLDQLF